jgi:threonine/homoserine/homoserine lactone efflux protein
MTWQTWLLFVGTSAILGPAVLFVLSQAVHQGAAKSVWASTGILTANAIYFALSATSLSAILLASHNLFLFIKWAGAAYLVWLGLRCFFGKESRSSQTELRSSSKSGGRIWVDGFCLQLANPKALVYFTAFLPQFIDPTGSVWFQVFILGVTNTVTEFVILFAYGQLAGRAWALTRRPGFEKATNRVAGSLLIGAGLGLANLRRA